MESCQIQCSQEIIRSSCENPEEVVEFTKKFGVVIGQSLKQLLIALGLSDVWPQSCKVLAEGEEGERFFKFLQNQRNIPKTSN